MEIKQVLQLTGARLSYGNRWMVWCSAYRVWEVYERKAYAKNSTCICSTDDESIACKNLIEG